MQNWMSEWLIVWFQKISIPSPRRVIWNSEGVRGVFNTKIFKGKYKAKLEFPEGCRGSNQKSQKPSVGEYGCFLEQHIKLRETKS